MRNLVSTDGALGVKMRREAIERDRAFHAAAHNLLHRLTYTWHMSQKFIECIARHRDRIDGSCRADGGIAWLIGNERSFAEDISRVQSRHRLAVALNGRFAPGEEVHLVAAVARLEDQFAG